MSEFVWQSTGFICSLFFFFTFLHTDSKCVSVCVYGKIGNLINFIRFYIKFSSNNDESNGTIKNNRSQIENNKNKNTPNKRLKKQNCVPITLQNHFG